MTVCELVDLLIYNGIIKCLNKKRVKPGEEEAIEGDGDDVIKCKDCSKIEICFKTHIQFIRNTSFSYVKNI